MVTRRKLTTDRFLSSSWPSAQPQQARPTNRTPYPPPPSNRQKKKQRLDDPLVRTTSEAPTKTPPRPFSGIVIREPVSGTQPAALGGTEVASSSQAVPNWQPTFILGGEPLLATGNVKMWAQGHDKTQRPTIENVVGQIVDDMVQLFQTNPAV
nr:hypothetical protein CFP56_58604 [Quercus suber]